MDEFIISIFYDIDNFCKELTALTLKFNFIFPGYEN